MWLDLQCRSYIEWIVFQSKHKLVWLGLINIVLLIHVFVIYSKPSPSSRFSGVTYWADQALGQTHLVHKTHPTPKNFLPDAHLALELLSLSIVIITKSAVIIADIVVLTDVIDVYSSFIGKIRPPIHLQFVNSIFWKTDSTDPLELWSASGKQSTRWLERLKGR